jgi:hypothetical protein
MPFSNASLAKVFANDKELLFELVLKNLYILTTNIAGLAIETSSTVDELCKCGIFSCNSLASSSVRLSL